MCGPVMGIVGAAVSAVGAIQSANAQAAGLEAQAEYNKRQALIESDSGRYEAGRTVDKGKRIIGEQIVGFARAGLMPSVGSASDVAKDTQTEIGLDVASIKYGAKIRSSNFNHQAKIDKMNAGLTKQGGIINAVTGMVGAFGNLAPSFGGGTTPVNIGSGIY